MKTASLKQAFSFEGKTAMVTGGCQNFGLEISDGFAEMGAAVIVTSRKRDKAEARHHSTTMDAARIALEAGARKLIIAHFSSRCRDVSRYEAECRTVFPETFAASDGDVFEI